MRKYLTERPLSQAYCFMGLIIIGGQLEQHLCCRNTENSYLNALNNRYQFALWRIDTDFAVNRKCGMQGRGVLKSYEFRWQAVGHF